MHLQENAEYDLWPWPWGQCHIKYCLVHNATHASAKFEVAKFTGLGEDEFTRKYIIWHLVLT